MQPPDQRPAEPSKPAPEQQQARRAKALSKLVWVGPVSSLIMIEHYSVELVGAFERARWRWGTPGVNRRFPNRYEIAAMIRSLIENAPPVGCVMSGGLTVSADDGEPVLYIDRKLSTSHEPKEGTQGGE